jgi:hypothetical protein
MTLWCLLFHRFHHFFLGMGGFRNRLCAKCDRGVLEQFAMPMTLTKERRIWLDQMARESREAEERHRPEEVV